MNTRRPPSLTPPLSLFFPPHPFVDLGGPVARLYLHPRVVRGGGLGPSIVPPPTHGRLRGWGTIPVFTQGLSRVAPQWPPRVACSTACPSYQQGGGDEKKKGGRTVELGWHPWSSLSCRIIPRGPSMIPPPPPALLTGPLAEGRYYRTQATRLVLSSPGIKLPPPSAKTPLRLRMSPP